MTTLTATSSAPASFPPWHDLPPDLLGHIITRHLPFPTDRAHFRVVCRAWHAAARDYGRNHFFPWIVLPNGSFCTAGVIDAAAGAFFFSCIPGLPDDATCLGAAAGGPDSAGGWLVLDCTDAIHRRTSLFDKIQSYTLEPPSDVRHRHAYLLYNPFSGATVPLPELDAIAGDVVEAFEIRKVVMQSSSPDDIVVVTTNCKACSVIVLRPGMGASVVRYQPVFDVTFVGDMLYGITPDEDLIAFDLAEDGNGKPVFGKFKRVIRHPLADGEEDPLSWMDEDDDDDEEEEEEFSSIEEQEFDDEWPNQIEDSFGTYGKVPDGTVNVEDTEGQKADDEPKDHIITTRYLLKSSNGEELLMARHHVQSTPFSGAYTREFELFRADLDSGKWVPVTRGSLAGEAVFLSRSFSMCTSAYGGIDDGRVYFARNVEDVFDTRSWTSRTFSLPSQREQFNGELLTWLFPPKLVL
ncbi:unnamed protein product [Urochloa humidicola]